MQVLKRTHVGRRSGITESSIRHIGVTIADDPVDRPLKVVPSVPLTAPSTARTVLTPAVTPGRPLNPNVLFFVDQVVAATVSQVARQQAQTAQLTVTGESGKPFKLSVSTICDGDEVRFLAYDRDVCLFADSNSTLYVIDKSARELENSIYLYLSEKLGGESAVRAQVFYQTGSAMQLPMMEGDSKDGPNSLKPSLAKMIPQ